MQPIDTTDQLAPHLAELARTLHALAEYTPPGFFIVHEQKMQKGLSLTFTSIGIKHRHCFMELAGKLNLNVIAGVHDGREHLHTARNSVTINYTQYEPLTTTEAPEK